MKKMLMLLLFLGFIVNASATIYLPEKQSQLFQTYGLFTEEGSTALFNQGGSKYWAELAAKIAIVQFDQNIYKPELMINAGVMDSLRYKKSEFQSDTQDLRISVSLLMSLNPETRLMISVTHLSGHVLEDVADKDLIPLDVGDESLSLRIIHDWEKRFRIGGTLKYIFGAEGSVKRLIADQFFEWAPLGEKMGDKNFTPYTAYGLEENGYTSYALSYHAQMGIYWGNHFSEIHSEIVRLLIGYYSGLDVRSKYSHFKHTKSEFLYGGLAYDY